MKFWDSSAVIPLLISEDTTPIVTKLMKEDPIMIVWALTPVECYSALYRRERESRLSHQEVHQFKERLQKFEEAWTEVNDLDRVRLLAKRLLAVHPLRSADALQLAAALVINDPAIPDASMVTFDRTLAIAAEKEGLKILGTTL